MKTKATIPSLFILPITYDQLAACFTGFVSANRIGKLKRGDAEVFEQLPYIRMVVDRQHEFAIALRHCFGQQLIL